MTKAEQEKQAEAVARQRLLSFDCGIESCITAFGLEKKAVAKAAGAKDFREFASWTLDVACAAAKQQEQAQAK